MGYWNLYFVAKLILFLGHHIGFHVMANLAFALSLAFPLRRRWQRVVRLVLAIPVGLALLYYDSWLPGIQRALSQMPALESFTPDYLAELAGRFVNPWVVAAMAVAVLAYHQVKDRLRVSTFVMLGMLVAPLAMHSPAMPVGFANSVSPTSAPDQGPLGPAQLDAALADFYKQQAALHVNFEAPKNVKTPFDIIIVHICSLAWDDLAVAGQKDAALLRRFDILFDDFSSAASYSGPAVIRLLRASCGQPRHDELYKLAERGCYLFDQLQAAGFEPQLLMNHDGKFGKFIDDVRERGGLKAPLMGDLGAAAQMKSFDGSPVYEDFDLLGRWLDKRKQSPAAQVALFYSTVSLHDGNVVDFSKSRSSLDTYGPRLKQLLDDIDRFIARLEAEGRPTIVVFVPEHGANLRGDSMQIPGMRELPTPRIAHVPLGIKLVGLHAGSGQVVVSQPSSYIALSTLLSRFVAQNPYDQPQPDLAAYVAGLPQTDFVAENENTVVVRHGSRYYIRMPDGGWNPFDSQ